LQTRESNLGVIQLIGRVFAREDQKEAPAAGDIIFSGQTRLDAKRAMLRYWMKNQFDLGLDLPEFKQRCRLLNDDRTIVFKVSY
jgi:hypothetical protein